MWKLPQHLRSTLSLALFLLLPLLLVASAQAGTTYYLAANGNDANNGLSSQSPWLTPDHPVNCGDTVLAVPGTNYASANFYTGKWGAVSCPAGNNVAWLKCQVFDACKISTSTNQGMWVDSSFWGVTGWEVTTTANDTYGACFIAQPNWNHPTTIHHIIFANNVANGCSQAGFTSAPNVAALTGVDYLALVGNIAYNAAQGSTSCGSGISLWEPVASDGAPGTHIYIAGNFSYANLDPSWCDNRSATDGEGIILDSFDGAQTQGIPPYSGQTVVTNNIMVGNGGAGLEISNQTNTSTGAIFLTQNTTWGDLTDPNQAWIGCSELHILFASDVYGYGNIFSTNTATACSGHAIYGLGVANIDATDVINNTLFYGYGGNVIFTWASPGFGVNSSNLVGVSPAFLNPSVPGAPACSGTANVPACMAGLVNSFYPQTSAAKLLGYHPPSATPVNDPLFPQWLCTAGLPSGLVTMGCASGQ